MLALHFTLLQSFESKFPADIFKVDGQCRKGGTEDGGSATVTVSARQCDTGRRSNKGSRRGGCKTGRGIEFLLDPIPKGPAQTAWQGRVALTGRLDYEPGSGPSGRAPVLPARGGGGRTAGRGTRRRPCAAGTPTWSASGEHGCRRGALNCYWARVRGLQR